MARPDFQQLKALLQLEPLPVEGGYFRQTWRSGASLPAGGPLGTATLAAFDPGPDCFSAFHRLPTDEVWHFYLGDPLRMVWLEPDGGSRELTLGQEVLAGQRLQVVVPAGTWMAAELAPGGQYAVFGNTMAPGFTSADYQGGNPDELIGSYPGRAADIERLTRRGHPLIMPPGL